jgi:DNA-directed RNA polymerase subunit RPC12/RpoP
MKVTQVKCPECEQPIYQKQRDEMILCKNCGTIHHRDIKGVHRVVYEIAGSEAKGSEQRYYMPFWRMYAILDIRNKSVEGGYLHKLSQMVKGEQGGGGLFIFVPACDLDTAAFRQWSVGLTTNNPPYKVRKDFNNIERLPTTLSQEDAVEMADFVVVTLEAEKPGMMQYLDYSLDIKEAKLVYLPFVNGPRGLQLAL